MKQATGIRWLKRLFSTQQAAPAFPVAVLELLQSGAPVQVQKVAGQGRGLVAARDLEYGETIFSEQPYLCIPALSKRKQLCYHCLKVLPNSQLRQDPNQPQPVCRTRSGTFCSQSCLAAAQGSYYALESQVDMTRLHQYCEAHGERFPLLAARLALMVAQRALQPGQVNSLPAVRAEGGATMSRFSTGSSSSTGRNSTSLQASSWLSSTSSSRAGNSQGDDRLSARSSLDVPAGGTWSQPAGTRSQEDPSAPLSFLCYANVPPPPPAPWLDSHQLLLGALEAAAACREDPKESRALAAALDSLDVDWYVAVLARLHLNTFKVDAVFPMDWDNPYAAAAALMQPGSSSGSALYLLASLFNHSCEPSVNVNFPGNDATAVFTAARRISAGEQLFISYTDTEQEVDVRQEYLAFAYGFKCQCTRCREEVAELRKGMPLQPQ